MGWNDYFDKASQVLNPLYGAAKAGEHAVHNATKGRSNTEPGNALRDQATQDYLDAIKQFEQGGNEQYKWQGDFDGGPSLGASEMSKISQNPQYAGYEQQALRDLEDQSKNGLSLRDEADIAKLNGQVNAQNAGRIGAIQQSMAARGMGGSGMDLVAQMQASQDATQRQALASMEKAAQAQEARRGATAQLGQLSGQLSSRDFQQNAQKAAAQDAINRFNVANQQNAAQMNWQGKQNIANQNVGQNNLHAQNVLSAHQGGAQMQYNQGTDQNNMNAARDAAQNAQKAQIAQAVIGGAGAAAKYFAHGGVVPGKANVPGDSTANDTVPAMLSPGEVVIPRSMAQGRPASVKDKMPLDHNHDAIDHLLKAMSSMQKGKK